MYGASRLLGRIVVATAATAALLCGSVGVAAAATPDRQAPGGQAPRVLSRYNVIVQTSDEWFAGTDADIHFKPYGCDDTEAGFVNLDNSEDNFEVGKLDRFGPYRWDLNGVCQIVLKKYNNGSDWQMDYVHVNDVITGRVYICLPENATHGYFGDDEWHYFHCA